MVSSLARAVRSDLAEPTGEKSAELARLRPPSAEPGFVPFTYRAEWDADTSRLTGLYGVRNPRLLRPPGERHKTTLSCRPILGR